MPRKTATRRQSGTGKRSKPPSDLPTPHARADVVAQETLSALMEEIASQVHYARFAHLSVERFQLLTRLVRYDLYSDGTDAQMATWLGVVPEELEKLREMEEYHKITDEVRLAFIAATTPKMFKEHLDDRENQDKLFRHMLRKGITSQDLKFSSRLVEKLAEATVPRALPATQSVTIQIAADQAHLIASTLEEVKQLHESAVVDGEYSELHPGETEGPSGTGET